MTLAAAYRATRYDAGGAIAIIGRRSAAIDALLARWHCHSAAFIAPGNPLSRRMPDGWNARRMAALAELLHHVPHVRGWGAGRGWREPHVLAALPHAHARVVARRFRQAAIVVVGQGRRARLSMLAPRARSAP